MIVRSPKEILAELGATLLKRADFAFVAAVAQGYPDSGVYLVGGAVRDALLGRMVKDIDIVVSGVPMPELEALLSRFGEVKLVGKAFGVLKFMPNEREFTQGAIDVALPRSEGAWKTGGYRDVTVQADHRLSIEDDLSRRDFTINAMAWDLNTEHLVDPYGGVADLEGKLIRAVGQARVRFHEDYTRILRGLRLACQLSFSIEGETWGALVALTPQLNETRVNGDRSHERIIPTEVVSRELLRALTYDPVRAFDLYDQSGAWEALMPELLPMRGCPQPSNYHTEGDVWTHTRLALAKLASPEFTAEFPHLKRTSTLALAVLLHDVAKPDTLQTPERDGVDRIRFNGHDRVGAQHAMKIGERMHWSAAGEWAAAPEAVCWLVAHHLLLVHAPVDAIKASTLERYFFNPQRPGQELLALFFCDGSATIPAAGQQPNLVAFRQLRQRLERMGSAYADAQLPAPLIHGEDVMSALGLTPGPEVKRWLTEAREAQLNGQISTKAEAIAYLKKLSRAG